MKQTNSNPLNQLPLILQLNAGGEPVRWIDYEKSAYFHSKNRVLWTLSEREVVLRGGINAKTGERSTLKMSTIVALNCKHSPRKFLSGVPSLSNRTLFTRDRNICGYCANTFPKSDLTRDHVVPKSKGGENTWTNLVTACKKCNHKKSNRTPKEASMPLIYVPYVPNYNEHLILQNKKILVDQMDYLMQGVSANSKIREMIRSGKIRSH